MSGYPIPFGRIIRLGSVGKDTQGVQRALAQAGYGTLGGLLPIFGPGAVWNLKRFQKAVGIVRDGVYGPVTHGWLRRYFDDFAYLLYIGHAPPSTATVQLPSTFKPTHQTGGLPGFPAIDVFAKAGTRVLAPTDGKLVNSHLIPWNVSKRVGGWTTYLYSDLGIYFLTHFADDLLPSDTQVKRGQDIGSIAAVPQNAWAPHIHEGLNTENVL